MNTFRLYSMAVWTLVMGACSSIDNEIEQQSALQQNGMHFTATISAPNSGAITRSTYAENGDGSISVAWKVGDQLALVHNSVKDVIEVTAVNSETGAATISGDINGSPANGDPVVLVYPAEAVYAATSGTGYSGNPAYDAKYLTQDGTLEYISSNLYLRTVSCEFSVSGSDVTLNDSPILESQIAIWKLSLQSGGSDIGATSVTVTIGSTAVASAASTGKSDYFLCVPSLTTSDGALNISAATSSGYYTYTKDSGINLAKSTYYHSTVSMMAAIDPMLSVPLTLEVINDGKIGFAMPKSGMQYTLNGGDKTEVSAGNINVVAGDIVQLYGNGTSITSYHNTQISATADCYIYGNIMSLVDETNFSTATTLAYEAFDGLFWGNENLFNHPTYRLLLPATVLAGSCYDSMFRDCTNLITAPTLPATTLDNFCYAYMFCGCTSLTTAPELPATSIATGCYQEMFNGCTNLTSAPSLPATTMANDCYYKMFYGCTNLSSAPDLPATSLARDCYQEMFSGCTRLITAPSLPATTLANSCYYSMFSGCTNLTTAPALPATTMSNYCYSSMFHGCTSLNSAPELPATTLAESCYSSMFSDCTNLTSAPALPATAMENTCYWFMFAGCTSLTSAPELPATTLEESCYSYMFSGCTSLASAPALPATTLSEKCYKEMFNGCTNLTTVPTLPAMTMAENCYEGMFSYCTNLNTTPTLPATTLANSCYSYMFSGCTSLVSTPTLPATTMAENCYEGMFSECTNLNTASALPATTLANSCYSYMFFDCTNLITAPALPATTLANSCYNSMFSGCTNLTDAPTLPAPTLANSCYSSMFFGCANLSNVTCLATDISADDATSVWLYGVAATVTFNKASSMTGWGSGINGIPSGWTVTNATP